MRRPSRRWRTATIGVAALTLLVTGTTSATYAAPDRASSRGASPYAAAAEQVAGAPAIQVTLLTGDRVTVGADADGKPVVVGTDPARRVGRAQVAFQTARHGEHLYVLPSDATGLVAADRVDLDLFDVAYLANNGYADADKLPLIVRYEPRTRESDVTARAEALPASARTRTLESIDAAAVTVTTKQAATFWSAVAGPTPTALRGGVARISLDRKVQANLDKSVPQIGAPTAWDAGLDGSGVSVAVLDTGIDPDHPDVAGKVDLLENFTPERDAIDRHGHGTHVASTIAGSGAASDGKYKGVAPGVDLLIGKVLDNTGSGNESQVIDGMEWAAEHDARIVNLSLGGNPTDGTDALSQAVGELTATHGTLFVVAGGNSGGPAQRIGAPGAADAALTVAAVDKAEKLASFSSRGPRAGDRGLKPDIAAPGVDIVAARASGTSLGRPVDGDYTSLDGTSMATPHVAGATAILAQQHPDWTSSQLKAALMSTAKDLGYTAFEQGTGRVDVARAFRQRVYADGSLDFGRFSSPTSSLTRTVTYTNGTDAPVRLTLDPTLRDYEGDRARQKMLVLDRRTVTVPAGGSATVRVTIDPRQAEAGAYQGAVRAADSTGKVRLTTTIGLYVAPTTAELTVRTTLPAGATDARISAPLAFRMDGRDDLDDGRVTLPAGSPTADLAKGVYLVGTAVSWKDAGGDWNFALPVAPQVDLTKPTTVTFDLRRAEKFTVTTPKAAERYDSWFGYQRVGVRGSWQVTGQVHATYGAQNYWVLPTGRVTQGSFRHFDQHLLGAPLVQMTAIGADPARINARYQGVEPQLPKLEGTRELPLVSAGRGLPADFEGLDVDGKIVVLSLADLCQEACTGNALDRVTRAADAGAAAVLAFGTGGRAFLDPARSWPTYPIPTMSLPADEGRALTAALGKGAVRVRIVGTTESPYLYSLKFDQDGRAPNNPHRKVTRGDLYQIENRVHADSPAQAQLTWDSQRAGSILDGSVTLTSTTPRSYTEYVGPLSDDALWWRTQRTGEGPLTEAIDGFARAGKRTEHWGKQPLVPGNLRFSSTARKLGPSVPFFGGSAKACFPCRSEDVFTPTFVMSDGVSGHVSGNAWYSVPDTNGGVRYGGEMHLYRGENEVPVEIRKYTWCILFCFSFYLPVYNLSPDAAAYRLTDHRPTDDPGQRYATTVDTSWGFTSRRATDAPPSDHICVLGFYSGRNVPCQAERLLYLGYDVDLDLDNTVPAAGRHTVTISGYHDFRVDPAPKVRSVELSVTFDGGEHWQRVPTRSVGDNTFTAAITTPASSGTTGTVGLRTTAKDSEGNTIEQTVHDAYGIKDTSTSR